ncbi:hypothetical protein M422DRAFT_259989 [Sphaerobolus stellatus SS14]|uniref:Uncharacterized protein n=1 Tax=Sphaerobolus stellatus (strain SS14) TaxID=990650 RepID=A0A0C9US29_SPHS4|nr:hypothetical protein M422DRAFT_259989 [Sphaerobolus stellatus SS14]
MFNVTQDDEEEEDPVFLALMAWMTHKTCVQALMEILQQILAALQAIKEDEGTPKSHPEISGRKIYLEYLVDMMTEEYMGEEEDLSSLV